MSSAKVNRPFARMAILTGGARAAWRIVPGSGFQEIRNLSFPIVVQSNVGTPESLTRTFFHTIR
jgi:hypothetical protein